MTMLDTGRIWYEYSDALWRYIVRRVPDEPTAEDILQDVFLKIQAGADTLQDPGKIRPWVYAISRNTITDYFRTRRRHLPLPEALPAPGPEPDSSYSPGLVRCVLSMMDQLPPAYREALVLTVRQGMTQREMGRALGLSFSGAKTRVQRARHQLRQMLLSCCQFEMDTLGGVMDHWPLARPGLTTRH